MLTITFAEIAFLKFSQWFLHYFHLFSLFPAFHCRRFSLIHFKFVEFDKIRLHTEYSCETWCEIGASTQTWLGLKFLLRVCCAHNKIFRVQCCALYLFNYFRCKCGWNSKRRFKPSRNAEHLFLFSFSRYFRSNNSSRLRGLICLAIIIQPQCQEGVEREKNTRK